MKTGHRERIDAGVSFDWQSLPLLRQSIGDVSAGVTELHFRRVGKSHRGISGLSALRTLWARAVDQDFLDEISAVRNLETLYVDGLTATDLTPLAHNTSLQRLILIGGTKVRDLRWVNSLSAGLRVLFLERFFHCTDLSPLSALGRLESLGFEGGMDRKARVGTLAPLARIRTLRFLFLASTRVDDLGLAPLGQLARLELLECGGYFADSEFENLRNALPELRCDWFDVIRKYGSIRAGMAAAFPHRRR